ncbi:MAG: Asd/ArgC dimerization domain-containing protein [Chromatiales bacterium]
MQKLAILGANGLIMESLLEAIGKHPSLSGEIVLLGSAESIDTSIEFGQQTLSIADIEGQGFEEIDLVIATGEMPYEGDWLDRARHAGCVILDISGHLPGQQHRVGVVAGVNDALLDEVVPGDVVVLPDAATVQSATLLHPLLQKLEIERVSLFSCHSVSERGRSGVEEMARQTVQLLNGKPVRPLRFSRQVAFNLVPMDSDEGMGEPLETQSLIAERLRQVLQASDLAINVSCCWAPVFYGHTQVLHCSVAGGVELDSLKHLLSQIPYVDARWGAGEVPTAVSDASGNDYLTVGKVSVNAKNTTEFSLWAVADNLRFGIAGNAVKIIELLVKRLFISYS